VGDPQADTLAHAVALHRAGQIDAAAALYRAVLEQAPAQFDALHLLGVIEHQRGDAAAALSWFDRAVATGRQNAALHANRGAALRDLRRAEDALASLGQALALDPQHAKALNNRAAVLLDLGRGEEALEDVQRALAIDADHAPALYNRASALVLLGRDAQALVACERALVALPDHVELLIHRANLLRARGRAGEALASCGRAIALDPRHAGAHVGRGHALSELGRHADAAASYRVALDLAPQMPLLPGHALHARLRICDWAEIDGCIAQIAQGIDAGEPVCEPFVALLLPLTAAQQQRCAEVHVARRWPRPAEQVPAAPASADGRIRIAYFSADFREHPTAQLVAGLIEAHDRSRFEVTGFAFGPPVDDAMTERLRRTFDRFVAVHDQNDDAIVQAARRLGIQIAIDLGGHTRGSRTGIFARRAAPLQLAWLGYPGTTGAPFIEHLIADATVVPAAQLARCTEKVVWLPHGYQANDVRREIAQRVFTRRELGLPDDSFVFCCFNNPAKISPTVFSIWMRLLQAVPGSMLWLLQADPIATDNLRGEARRRGIDPQRLEFAPRWPLADHLARHRAADLFLDTWPYNAHTTASDALWAGLPVLTRIGEAFAGRVAASLLRAIGLDELIAGTDEDYEARALALATEPARLAALRERLAAQRLSAPLFDTARFARAFEAALSALWQRHERGLPRMHLEVRERAGGDLVVVEHAPVAEPAGGVQAGLRQ
jgi:protein O-GlcNAc transferase